jgi:hypothetical protein
VVAPDADCDGDAAALDEAVAEIDDATDADGDGDDGHRARGRVAAAGRQWRVD